MTQPDVTASSYDFEFSGSEDDEDRASEVSENESESEPSQPTASILLFDSRYFCLHTFLLLQSGP